MTAVGTSGREPRALDTRAMIGWHADAHRLQDQLVTEYSGDVAPGRVLAVTVRRFRDSYRQRGVHPHALRLAEARARLALGTIRPPVA
jgi:hypothetical protein